MPDKQKGGRRRENPLLTYKAASGALRLILGAKPGSFKIPMYTFVCQGWPIAVALMRLTHVGLPRV